MSVDGLLSDWPWYAVAALLLIWKGADVYAKIKSARAARSRARDDGEPLERKDYHQAQPSDVLLAVEQMGKRVDRNEKDIGRIWKYVRTNGADKN